MAGISPGEGERVISDDGASTPPSEPLKIVRASTRFECRIRPEGEGLVTLKTLDSVTQDIARARNAAVRAHAHADGAWLDANQATIDAWKAHRAEGASAKGLQWWGARAKYRNKLTNPDGIYSYDVMRRAAPRLKPTIVAALQKVDDADWIASRFDVLVRCAKAPRHYKPTQPIRIPHAIVKLERVSNNETTASFALEAEAVDAKKITLTLVARDEWQREELRALTAGEWKLGDLVLERHAKKHGRWFVRLCYTRFVPLATGPVTVVARRGMRSFLIGAASTGECRVVHDGGELIAFNKQMMARRRSLGAMTKQGTMGSGATGHGTKRRVAKMIALSDTELAYKRAACKRAANALVLFAKRLNAKEVVFEDFAAPKHDDAYWLIKRWPWYQLTQSCETACENAGIKTRAVIVYTDRRTCPSCSHVHVEAPVAVNNGERLWECASCGMRRTPDMVDALDMMRTVVGGAAVERAEGVRKKIGRTLASGGVREKRPAPLAVPNDGKSADNPVRPGSVAGRPRKQGGGRSRA